MKYLLGGGGMAVGGMLFGPFGALVGGMIGNALGAQIEQSQNDSSDQTDYSGQ